MKGKKLLAVTMAALMTTSSVGATVLAEEITSNIGNGISVLGTVPASTDVAQIGDTTYTTLEEAMNTLSSMSGDVTIKLLSEATYKYNAGKDFTKNYAGNITFEGSAENRATVLNLYGKDTDQTPIDNNGKLIFKNLTINKTNANEESGLS